MAASTYTQKANLAQRGKIVSVCPSSVYVSRSTLANGLLSLTTTPMTAVNSAGIPGAIKSTIAADVFRIPIRKEDSKMVFYIVADACASSSSYMTLAIRKPSKTSTLQDYSPNWMAGVGVGTSTEATGWKMVFSTAKCLTLSSETESFIAGPFESAQYAMNFGPTSTSGIDANQNFFEIMVGLSTAYTAANQGSTQTWLEFSSSPLFGAGTPALYVIPIEVP